MQTPTKSSRLLLAVLGLALIAAGAGGTWMLWTSFARAMETRRWTAAPCLITRSDVEASQPDPTAPAVFRPVVRYRYSINGAPHESGRIKRGEDRTMPKAKAQSICDAHRLGTEATCFVNPASSDEAVLEQASKAAIYSIWFPLLFVAGGAGMIMQAFRRTR